MKIDNESRDYKVGWIFGFTIGAFLCLIICVFLIGVIGFLPDISVKCKPSQETQLLQSQLTKMQQSQEVQIGDLAQSIDMLPRCVK